MNLDFYVSRAIKKATEHLMECKQDIFIKGNETGRRLHIKYNLGDPVFNWI